ncbi:hypothetical protein [Blastopirellula marina]|nr:hypothetical protein [Blastopirellula marina]
MLRPGIPLLLGTALLVAIVGCSDPPLPTQLPTSRIQHPEGFSVPRFPDWTPDADLQSPRILSYYQRKPAGRSDALFEVIRLPGPPDDSFTSLDEYEQVGDAYFRKQVHRSGTFDDPPLVEFDLIQQVNEVWFMIMLKTSIDLDNGPAFIRLIADGIEVREPAEDAP